MLSGEARDSLFATGLSATGLPATGLLATGLPAPTGALSGQTPRIA